MRRLEIIVWPVKNNCEIARPGSVKLCCQVAYSGVGAKISHAVVAVDELRSDIFHEVASIQVFAQEWSEGKVTDIDDRTHSQCVEMIEGVMGAIVLTYCTSGAVTNLASDSGEQYS